MGLEIWAEIWLLTTKWLAASWILWGCLNFPKHQLWTILTSCMLALPTFLTKPTPPFTSPTDHWSILYRINIKVIINECFFWFYTFLIFFVICRDYTFCFWGLKFSTFINSRRTLYIIFLLVVSASAREEAMRMAMAVTITVTLLILSMVLRQTTFPGTVELSSHLSPYSNFFVSLTASLPGVRDILRCEVNV